MSTYRSHSGGTIGLVEGRTAMDQGQVMTSPWIWPRGGVGTRTVDELLAEARSVLPHRPGPTEALSAQAKGSLLVDIRGDDQRRADGLIPGALVLPRNSLEWRCDLTSPWRHPVMNDRSRRLILVCNEGFQSSLAAAILHRLGLVNATDLDGGFVAWAAAGLPVTSAGDLAQLLDARKGRMAR